MRRRARAKKNPSTGAIVVVGVGVALLGIGAYFLLKKPAADQAASQAPTPQLPALGDPNDPNSIAYACKTATMLTRIGHPREAAAWAAKCTAGGGTVV